jgi:hypothetical protein
MKSVKINKDGSVSRKSMNKVLSLPEAGYVAYFQGNVRQYSKVRGNDDFGFYAMNPTIAGCPHVKVLKIDEQFIF